MQVSHCKRHDLFSSRGLPIGDNERTIVAVLCALFPFHFFPLFFLFFFSTLQVGACSHEGFMGAMWRSNPQQGGRRVLQFACPPFSTNPHFHFCPTYTPPHATSDSGKQTTACGVRIRLSPALGYRFSILFPSHPVLFRLPA